MTNAQQSSRYAPNNVRLPPRPVPIMTVYVVLGVFANPARLQEASSWLQKAPRLQEASNLLQKVPKEPDWLQNAQIGLIGGWGPLASKSRNLPLPSVYFFEIFEMGRREYNSYLYWLEGLGFRVQGLRV